MTFDEIYATMKTYFEQRDFEVFGQGVILTNLTLQEKAKENST